MSGQMPVMDPKILSVFPGLFLGGSRAALGVGLLCCRLPGRHRSEVPGSHLRLLDCIVLRLRRVFPQSLSTRWIALRSCGTWEFKCSMIGGLV